MEVGKRIRALRTARGLTQEELGKLLGVKMCIRDRYYMVQKNEWDPVEKTVTEEDGVVKIRTSEMEIRVQKSPLRIGMYDLEGNLLSKDADDQGLYWSDDGTRGVKKVEGTRNAGGIFGFGSGDHGRRSNLNRYDQDFTEFSMSHGRVIAPFFMSTVGYGIFLNTIAVSYTHLHFWSTFKRGAQDAGVEQNVYVEFADVSAKDPGLIAEAAEQAVYSAVDGLALQAADEERTAEVLQQAERAQIPVLTFESDLFPTTDIPTVGSNSYDAGYSLGRMAVQACDGKATAVILVESALEDTPSSSRNLKVQGIMNALSDTPGIEVAQVYPVNVEHFEVEKSTNEILDERPDVDLILCTGETSTPGVAQVLVDANRVGDICVIGYGAMPQTLDYIERGVIYGSVCPDAYQIGYQSVKQLCRMLDGETVSNSLNTSMYTVTADNLEEFREQTAQQNVD